MHPSANFYKISQTSILNRHSIGEAGDARTSAPDVFGRRINTKIYQA